MSANPTMPYTNWVTAATNIQDAVNVARTKDVVVVTNGVYPGGVVVTNPLMLTSANGPQFTLIDGAGAKQCLLLADGASLTGFTLANGHTNGGYGGGVGCSSMNAFLTNCVLSGNSAYEGDGAWGGTLYNCTLVCNSAVCCGGGAQAATLCRCRLFSNSVGTNAAGAGPVFYRVGVLPSGAN